MEWKKYSTYVYLAFVSLLAIGAILIIRPFFTPIVLAIVFAYWLLPLHRKISKYFRETPSALIISISLFVLFLGLIQYGIFVFAKEIIHISEAIKTVDVSTLIPSLFGDKLSEFAIGPVLSQISTAFASKATSIVYSVPGMVISFFAFLLTFYYLLMDADKIIAWLRNNIPFPVEQKTKMMKNIKNYMDAFLKTHIIISLVQGAVCALLFFMFGLTDYILVGSLAAAVLSMLPIIGPYILYVPLGIGLIAKGQVGYGIGLMGIGLAIGSFLDYVIRPHMTGRYASMHPLASLVGLLGGMAFFGVVGIFIGPIILGLCITVLENISEYQLTKND